jgi:hypothetical protein
MAANVGVAPGTTTGSLAKAVATVGAAVVVVVGLVVVVVGALVVVVVGGLVVVVVGGLVVVVVDVVVVVALEVRSLEVRALGLRRDVTMPWKFTVVDDWLYTGTGSLAPQDNVSTSISLFDVRYATVAFELSTCTLGSPTDASTPVRALRSVATYLLHAVP